MEKTLSSNTLHRGRNFDFLQDKVELPNGRRTIRYVVRHPGAVAIVPLLPDGRILLVRQYRYAAGKNLLEIPAGTLEPGEDPFECAKRELREETGFEAGELRGLLSCFMAPGYSSEVIHFFAARDLREVGAEQEPDEAIENEALELGEILEQIRENAIEDAKTIVGILTFSSRA
ncbi:MAG: NUDIX hydrolase [Candidatus Bathyarchaeota archaeon]|nr:NUDIX hydrolase [Candidatus Bathyarchaeota archaeon]